jgi:hypothetical protein
MTSRRERRDEWRGLGDVGRWADRHLNFATHRAVSTDALPAEPDDERIVREENESGESLAADLTIHDVMPLPPDATP